MLLIKCATFLVAGVILTTKTSADVLAEQRIQSYVSCQTDRDCKENAFCFGNDDTVLGNCKCLKGFELIRNTTYYECLEGVQVGDACEKDIECQIIASSLALCNTYRICECNTESHNFEGRCHMKIKIEEICKTDYNCFLDDGTKEGTHGYCVDGRCSCPKGKKPSEDKTQCLTSRKLGEKCIADEECTSTTPNSRCSEICRCAAEYTLSRDESVCIKAATQFEEQCDFDGQCSEYLQESICNSNKCGCQDTFHGYGNRCVPTKKIGERCDEDAQCLYEKILYNNVKCDNSSQTCKCLFGTTGDSSCKIEKTNDNSSASTINYVICIHLLVVFRFLNYFLILNK